jgi:hypothetical protein
MNYRKILSYSFPPGLLGSVGFYIGQSYKNAVTQFPEFVVTDNPVANIAPVVGGFFGVLVGILITGSYFLYKRHQISSTK